MLNRKTTIVPLETANSVLSAFGIGTEDREYQRWRQDDGFRLADLEDMLVTSPFMLGVDWRDLLEDAVATIVDQLGALGISVESDLDEDGHGYIEIAGKREPVQYVSSDGDDFDRVIRNINSLIATTAHYRRFRPSEGSDGWWYGLLPNDAWKRLETSAVDLTRYLFAEFGATTVEVVEGDLLDHDVDVIVNAWNRNVIP